MGSPRAVVEAQRDVAVWSWPLSGEAFGNDQPIEDVDGDGTSLAFNLRFPGQRYDAASGLNQNGARDYDAGGGRYVESDPMGLDAGAATYAYVSGKPLGSIDPLGLLGMDDVWGGIYSATNGWSPSQGMVDAVTGFGDGINILGYSPSRAIRKGWGIDGGLNRCSPEYLAARDTGDWYSLMLPVAGRLGYMSRIAGGARAATSVEGAYAARAAIKAEYRSVFRPIFAAIDRDPTLAQILAKAAVKGDAYAIARSGIANWKYSVGILDFQRLEWP